MSVSTMLDRCAPAAGARYLKPDGPLFHDEYPSPDFHYDVGAKARELEALVDGARRLVTVDAAWALWALECAVDDAFVQNLDDDSLTAALSSLAAGVDGLSIATRRAPAPYRPPRIDRRRLDAALDYIGHQGKPAFRARVADAYDAAPAAEVL